MSNHKAIARLELSAESGTLAGVVAFECVECGDIVQVPALAVKIAESIRLDDFIDDIWLAESGYAIVDGKFYCDSHVPGNDKIESVEDIPGDYTLVEGSEEVWRTLSMIEGVTWLDAHMLAAEYSYMWANIGKGEYTDVILGDSVWLQDSVDALLSNGVLNEDMLPVGETCRIDGIGTEEDIDDVIYAESFDALCDILERQGITARHSDESPLWLASGWRSAFFPAGWIWQFEGFEVYIY